MTKKAMEEYLIQKGWRQDAQTNAAFCWMNETIGKRGRFTAEDAYRLQSGLDLTE